MRRVQCGALGDALLFSYFSSDNFHPLAIGTELDRGFSRAATQFLAWRHRNCAKFGACSRCGTARGVARQNASVKCSRVVSQNACAQRWQQVGVSTDRAQEPGLRSGAKGWESVRRNDDYISYR